ncbi:MAG: hypothetical protein K6G85_00425 [Eubacterium sp.]|nr:hypothetical protein [Eubacterium sp.]
MRDNCREANKCIYCKNWIGSAAKVDFLTGNATHSKESGLCKLDESGVRHSSESLCNHFSRRLSYY